MKAKMILTTIAAACLSFSVMAMTINDAKTQGLVGENASGYLGVIKGSSDVNKLVAEINKKRKAKYQQLAKKNKISLAQVEKLAAEKTFKKTSSGHFIQVNGQWVKK
ncbi:YdbL family protein [Pseudoalteromonas sp. SMS1]|uniref:YdbL family protein n=1 Tax=Pseudoalteromonas sp. SMS1 TaxID=2908894 RepID=UPI001F49064D|nr:YdbL family protein [Pseudoalteromonas sp. SMS1]MCF2859018.1 YdbL family protein [Pseudoalteromonas sp. SMS1]